MRIGVWWQGHSEIHCCSSAEGLEPGDRLEPQGADETGSNRVHLVLMMSASIILSATCLLFAYTAWRVGDSYPELRMRWLADEHAFQLLVEALHAAAQSRDQCRQGSERDGNWLSLRARKQVKWNLGYITLEKQLETDHFHTCFYSSLVSFPLIVKYFQLQSLYEECCINKVDCCLNLKHSCAVPEGLNIKATTFLRYSFSFTTTTKNGKGVGSHYNLINTFRYKSGLIGLSCHHTLV